MARWKRISALVSVENHAFLIEQMKSHGAESIGEALDRALNQVRCAHGRARLERETTAYYASLTPEQAAEERELEAALTHVVSADFE